jgi:hypothetical protein
MCLLVLPYDQLKDELQKINLELNDDLWLTIVSSIEDYVIAGDTSFNFNLEISAVEYYSFECSYFEDHCLWGFRSDDQKVALAKWINNKH